MDKLKVDRGILAQLTSSVANVEGLIIALNDGEYDNRQDLMLNLGDLRTRGKQIARWAQQAINELGEV